MIIKEVILEFVTRYLALRKRPAAPSCAKEYGSLLFVKNNALPYQKVLPIEDRMRIKGQQSFAESSLTLARIKMRLPPPGALDSVFNKPKKGEGVCQVSNQDRPDRL